MKEFDDILGNDEQKETPGKIHKWTKSIFNGERWEIEYEIMDQKKWRQLIKKETSEGV